MFQLNTTEGHSNSELPDHQNEKANLFLLIVNDFPYAGKLYDIK